MSSCNKSVRPVRGNTVHSPRWEIDFHCCRFGSIMGCTLTRLGGSAWLRAGINSTPPTVLVDETHPYTYQWHCFKVPKIPAIIVTNSTRGLGGLITRLCIYMYVCRTFQELCTVGLSFKQTHNQWLRSSADQLVTYPRPLLFSHVCRYLAFTTCTPPFLFVRYKDKRGVSLRTQIMCGVSRVCFRRLCYIHMILIGIYSSCKILKFRRPWRHSTCSMSQLLNKRV